MKKRRPCSWNQSRSPKNSPRPTHTRELVPVKTRSLHDSKRRRSQKTPSKYQPKSEEHIYQNSLKQAVSSLESIVDVKRKFHSLKIYEASLKYQCSNRGSVKLHTSKAKRLQFPEDSVERLFSSHTCFEPHIIEKNSESDYRLVHEKVQEKVEQFSETGEEEMETRGENNNEKESSETNMTEEAEEHISEEEIIRDETAEDEEEEYIEEEIAQSDVGKDGALENPLSYPVPKGMGEGIPIKPGGNRDSIISSCPLTDEAVGQEMKQAEERCKVIYNEITELKKELQKLTGKEDLTEEDTLEIQQKQEDLMSKLAEFEKITRKLQRWLGLADPSSFTFARMFDMVPISGRKEGMGEDIDETEIKTHQADPKRSREVSSRLASRRKPSGREVSSREGSMREASESTLQKKKDLEKMYQDRFEFPQMDYPEDKLPRVIVCGNTEDDIPKIVVADTERTGKTKCLQNLTGKLTESLTMQEKLAKENAQLEGGKYKLEEALLEKDTAVECLQRKVCGLQAEMRIVVKENTQLARQLACLNQREANPTCCYTCPGATSSSPRTTSSVAPPCSYSGSIAQDEYCSCSCCLQPKEQFAHCPTKNPCGQPDSYRLSSAGSPRLAGGASRTDCCFGSAGSSQVGGMCCRSPAAVKPTCPGPPPVPKGQCPAELENKLANYGNSTRQLEQQLGTMECEVRNLQMELSNVQRERQQLEQQRKLLKCTGPCAPCACCPPPPSTMQQAPSAMYMQPPQPMPPLPIPIPKPQLSQQGVPPMCTGPCVNAPMGASTCPQQQLRDLREQYARLQDDYKNKLCEVSTMRTDAEKMKQDVRDAKEDKEKMEIKLIDVQERLKTYESERDKFEGHKEQMVEQEQALIVAKQRFREAQDELEELRSLIQDQAAQLEDYRNKYLQAQQQVEEQRRQLDLMERDNARMNENVTLEIGRVKNQFQEKLSELAPLPDILKQTQVKLQEAQQMRLVAERNCEDLSRELLGCKDKIQTLQNQLDVLRKEHQSLQDENGNGSGKCEEMERKNSELRHENERMKNTLARFEEHEAQLQKRIDDKMHEITQLSAMLEQVREDSARQVARTKERCETVRRTMQGQIAEMEKQLAQCRATARAAQKDRDEIRQKMQGQINNLNEAFDQAQGRIRSLQGHVNYLKTSYSNIFKGQGETPSGLPDAAGAGYDSCDCNY